MKRTEIESKNVRRGAGRRWKWWGFTSLALTVFCGFLAVAGCFREMDLWLWETSTLSRPTSRSGGPAESDFVETTEKAGFTHRHYRPILDSKLDPIMPWVSSVGAAAAAGDFDKDGWIDLYVTNSRRGEPNYLYRNNRDGTFTDVAEAAGLARVNGEMGASMDAVWGDYDNDGWPDLYLVRWGRDSLYRNNGDSGGTVTFTEVTAESFRRADGSPGTDWKNGNTVVFLDYDLDGRLDVYVGNYFDDVDLWNLETTRIMHDDFEKARNGGLNQLFHQEDDGTFTEQAAAAGVEDPGWTLAVGVADVDNDGWPDLYAANDFGPDQLFLNLGDGNFLNATSEVMGFDTKKGMNVDFGDYDNDGWMDAYVTNITTAEYLQEGNMLWHNDGPGPGGTVSFTDVSMESGTYDGGWGWGAKFFDYDNDGDLDILSANGFISAGEGNFWYDLASWTVTGEDSADAANWPPIGDRSFSGYERLRLWENDGFGSFTERAAERGMDSRRDGRGVVCFDYDNDGDLDVFVANQHQPPQFYTNRAARQSSWLEVELVPDPATGVNRDGVGTRVTVVTRGSRRIRERDGGNGYSGQSDPRLHFGLGSESRVELLEVRWPDGGLQYLEDVAVNRLLTVRQDPGRYASRVRSEPTAPRRLSEPGLAAVPRTEDSEALEEVLGEMEEKIRAGRTSHRLASSYRARCAAQGRHERAVRFFEDRVAQRPDDAASRIELASAYIDKIPTCGGVAAIICKGTLARKALDQLDKVLEADPDSWTALYCRGINHLHWPRALRHSDDAARDLERALELPSGRPERRPHELRVWVALGDALLKAGEEARARRTWQRGLESFPGAGELEVRLAFESGRDLLAHVEKVRSLEQPIDTDLSFLDPPPDSDVDRGQAGADI